MTYRRTIATFITTACFIIICIACPTHQANAEANLYRIWFVDKGPVPCTVGTSLYNTTLAEFHSNALARRQRHGVSPLIDDKDAPIYQPYIDAFSSFGGASRPSRWNNTVLVSLDSASLPAVASLPYVRYVEQVKNTSYDVHMSPDCDPADYDRSKPFVELLNVQPLHNAGLYGQGVTLASIDTGFELGGHDAMKFVNVIGTYDVPGNDTIVSRTENDHKDQDIHGTATLSVMAGYDNHKFVGISPFAKYLLVKSEELSSERREEEDNLITALEWVERHGADITGIQLSYRDFDSTERSIDVSQLDGRTTYAAKAVNRATALGLSCVISAGNSGPGVNSLGTPADADSAITVGGIQTLDSIWTKSSYGLTHDNYLKPEVVALSRGVRVVDGTTYRFSDGTSLSGPQIAASLTLLRQLRPDATHSELRDALYATSRMPVEATGRTQYGLPNIYDAACRMGPSIGPPALVKSEGRSLVFAHVFAENTSAIDANVVFMGDFEDTLTIALTKYYENIWGMILPSIGMAAYNKFFVEIYQQGTIRRSPAIGAYDYKEDMVTVPCGFTFPPEVTGVDSDENATNAANHTGPPTSIVLEGSRTLRCNGIVSVIDASGSMQIFEASIDAMRLATGMYLIVPKNPELNRHLPHIITVLH